jgi:chromate reductase, NAD(P)H dehydrogenase (quinone)
MSVPGKSDGIRVLGISGSLRKGSFNTALLRAALERAPAGTSCEVADISAIPLYNEDLRQQQGFPAPVETLRAQIARADALLVATPEYNYSLPGVLKNAIDWASRSPRQPFPGKVLGVMGASGSTGGTMRAQYHLRQIAVYLDLYALNKPEVFVRNAASVFDAEGKLTEETTSAVVRDFMQALVKLAGRFKGG